MRIAYNTSKYYGTSVADVRFWKEIFFMHIIPESKSAFSSTSQICFNVVYLDMFRGLKCMAPTPIWLWKLNHLCNETNQFDNAWWEFPRNTVWEQCKHGCAQDLLPPGVAYPTSLSYKPITRLPL